MSAHPCDRIAGVLRSVAMEPKIRRVSAVQLPEGRIVRRYAVDVDDLQVGEVTIEIGSDGNAELDEIYVEPESRGHRLSDHLLRQAVTVAREFGVRRLGCHPSAFEFDGNRNKRPQPGSQARLERFFTGHKFVAEDPTGAVAEQYGAWALYL